MIPSDYSLKVGEKEYHFVFNTRAYRKYAESISTDYEGLLERLSKLSEPGKEFKMKDVLEILRYAHESYCAYNGKPFQVDELVIDAWLDQMGGIVQGIPEMGK